MKAASRNLSLRKVLFRIPIQGPEFECKKDNATLPRRQIILCLEGGLVRRGLFFRRTSAPSKRWAFDPKHRRASVSRSPSRYEFGGEPNPLRASRSHPA